MAKYKQLFTLCFFSLLIHVVLIALWFILKPEFVKIAAQKTIIVQLNKSDFKEISIKENAVEERLSELKKAPEPEVREILEDEHTLLPSEYYAGDEMQSSNQEDKSYTELKKGIKSATEKQKIAKQESSGTITTSSESESSSVSGEKNGKKKEAAEFSGQYNTLIGYDEETNESFGKEEHALQALDELNNNDKIIESVDTSGNYQWLNDQQLDAAFVKDPFSEKRHKELKIINIYFKQISDVIFSNWVNPLTPSEIKNGAYVKIILELNEDGYLIEPRLALQSRYTNLDQSLILAVKKSMSHQFDIPDSYLKKYRYLSLSWSSDGTEYELMPFEKETQKEKR